MIGLPIATIPTVLDKASGWAYYLKGFDLTFEVFLYFFAIELVGALCATVLAATIAPFMYRASSRERIADFVVKTAVCIVAFVDIRILLGRFLLVGSPPAALVRIVFLTYYVGFAIVMLSRRARTKVGASLDGSLTETTTRRAAAGLGAAAAAIVVTEAVVGKMRGAPADPPLRASRRPDRNILLITFDALNAEDMSLYGYHLPTTPHLERFGARSTVFDDYYSSATFTTPSVASILTGLQISEHRVYHLQDRLSEAQRPRTLPHLMKAGGFATGAVVSNPNVFLFNSDLADAYNVLPDMAYNSADHLLWNATAPFHQFEGPGNRNTEFWDLSKLRNLAPDAAEKYAGRYFWRLKSDFPASLTFNQARAAMKRLPDGYFMWVHVFAPHNPYLPDEQHAGRFLSTDEMRTETQQESVRVNSPYTPDLQPLVSKARLRYDEFLSDADAAFAEFMAQIEDDGKLRNTTVIVSADHGESFEGGIYMHATPFLTRPQLHVPLMIHTPGQTQGRRIKATADHTSLAPTILDLAGVPCPKWMKGPSLVPWLSEERDGAGEGIAFSQCLQTSSLFRPISQGEAGVICGGQQYTVDLGDGRVRLRPLSEADTRDRDHSAENPALAREMRAKLAARFPDIPQLRA
ncbi:MAG TPA: sulfatase [Bryobacteraceae bacterium]|nr:sulfatase [Bryobacteraceae bacterium]